MGARVLISFSLVLASGSLLAAAPATRQEASVEPGELQRVWTCPAHREVTEDEEGECPFCERALVPTLIQEAWSCPIHAVVSEPVPGKCPICRRELFLVTEEVTYACPMHPEVNGIEPGACPVCNMALVASTSTRPHQDHNPKHGGIFFMAPDNWHHLEGAYPEDGVFRVYLYDNFSQPLNAREFEARAVLEEAFDPAAGETRELVAYPLLASADGSYLEADVGTGVFPRAITAKIRFERQGPFERFDFIFPELSRESEASDRGPVTGAELLIPERPVDIVASIETRNARVRELVSRGAFDRIYLPALEAKDLALALERHLDDAPREHRRQLQWALKELVRAAWLLDDSGDRGNKEKVQSAFELFDQAVAGVRSVYRESR